MFLKKKTLHLTILKLEESNKIVYNYEHYILFKKNVHPFHFIQNSFSKNQ